MVRIAIAVLALASGCLSKPAAPVASDGSSTDAPVLDAREDAVAATTDATISLGIDVLFGDTQLSMDPGTQSGVDGASGEHPCGTAEAFGSIAAADGHVDTIAVYAATGNDSTQLLVGLYKDTDTGQNPSEPGALLARATIGDGMNPVTADSWHLATISPAVAVSKGDIYWIAVMCTTGNNLAIWYDYVSSPPVNTAHSLPGLSTFPNPWVTGGSYYPASENSYFAGSLH